MAAAVGAFAFFKHSQPLEAADVLRIRVEEGDVYIRIAAEGRRGQLVRYLHEHCQGVTGHWHDEYPL